MLGIAGDEVKGLLPFAVVGGVVVGAVIGLLAAAGAAGVLVLGENRFSMRVLTVGAAATAAVVSAGLFWSGELWGWGDADLAVPVALVVFAVAFTLAFWQSSRLQVTSVQE